ncbi:MAG: hypothetical protein KatS3mg015_3235 [Fimbriimonadales bacterium]|nr:MAG: hypothetical protein KatS3mg015_3235 [Fimbriimonadales bacterium]
MAEVVWTLEALDDLEAIGVFQDLVEKFRERSGKG